MGPIPSSAKEPLCEAKIALRAKNGSCPVSLGRPLKGTLSIIKYNIKAVNVHPIFALKEIFFSGFLSSKVIGIKGLKSSNILLVISKSSGNDLVSLLQR
jgi:hypothetical protein